MTCDECILQTCVWAEPTSSLPITEPIQPNAHRGTLPTYTGLFTERREQNRLMCGSYDLSAWWLRNATNRMLTVEHGQTTQFDNSNAPNKIANDPDVPFHNSARHQGVAVGCIQCLRAFDRRLNVANIFSIHTGVSNANKALRYDVLTV